MEEREVVRLIFQYLHERHYLLSLETLEKERYVDWTVDNKALFVALLSMIRHSEVQAYISGMQCMLVLQARPNQP